MLKTLTPRLLRWNRFAGVGVGIGVGVGVGAAVMLVTVAAAASARAAASVASPRAVRYACVTPRLGFIRDDSRGRRAGAARLVWRQITMGACASKAPEEHRADRALHLATRRKEGWGAPRDGEGTGRPAATTASSASPPTDARPERGVDEKMEEAGDSAPPVEEEEEEAPAPEPQTPRAPPPVPHLTLVFVGLDGAGKTAVIRALAANDGAGQRKALLHQSTQQKKERSARPRPRWR